MKLTSNEHSAFTALISAYMQLYKDKWRSGQILYNALACVNPELAQEINGTKYDPFHRNDECEEFWSYILKEE